MFAIEKTAHPPADWITWFTIDGFLFDNYESWQAAKGSPHKIVLEHLFKEQNGLCAYCESPMELSKASIEHIVPQSENPALSVSYHNLIAVCKIKDAAGIDVHCDSSRGNAPVLPLNFYQKSVDGMKEIWKHLRVNEQGEIDAMDRASTNFWAQSASHWIKVLNLNAPRLKPERKKAINALDESLVEAISAGKDKQLCVQSLLTAIQRKEKPYAFQTFERIYLERLLQR